MQAQGEAQLDWEAARTQGGKAPPFSKPHLMNRPSCEQSELLEHQLEQQDTERENQPKPGKLEGDGVAAEPETPPQPRAPLPPQQSLVAQPLPLPPLEKFGEDEQEGVVVAEKVVEAEEKGMVVDVEKGMEKEVLKVEMREEEQEELLQQQPQQQQQPQLPGAAAPNPWPPLLPAENESRQCASEERCPKIGWHCQLDDGCGDGDECNNELECGRQGLVLGGFGDVEDLVSSSVVWGTCSTRGEYQSVCEQDGNDWKRNGIGTEWPSGKLMGLGCEAAYRRLTRPRRKSF